MAIQRSGVRVLVSRSHFAQLLGYDCKWTTGCLLSAVVLQNPAIYIYIFSNYLSGVLVNQPQWKTEVHFHGEQIEAFTTLQLLHYYFP